MTASQPATSKSYANAYVGSPEADAASAYFNALPFEQRKALAPLLDHYRQMGLAEARVKLNHVLGHIDDRIRGIRND